MLDIDFLHDLLNIAHEAGQAILPFAQRPDTQSKSDGSPVTLADLAAHRVIVEALSAQWPEIACVSEEDAAHLSPESLRDKRFFLVDPLDGTKEFIQRSGEFTVNIALIDNGRPVAGVVHSPALGESWYGAVGVGAWKVTFPIGAGAISLIDDEHEQLYAQGTQHPDGWVVTGSRSHGDEAAMNAFLAGRPVAKLLPAGSSLKFCRIAEGAADLYPRLGPTMEWDTAAGQAVLEASGGWVCGLDGAPLECAKPAFRNPHFVAGSSVLRPADCLP
jgi:3'(2'), 5'-bisphosphate nucleotidase